MQITDKRYLELRKELIICARFLELEDSFLSIELQFVSFLRQPECHPYLCTACAAKEITSLFLHSVSISENIDQIYKH